MRGSGTAFSGKKVALNYLPAEVIEEQQAAVRAHERMGFEDVAAAC